VLLGSPMGSSSPGVKEARGGDLSDGEAASSSAPYEEKMPAASSSSPMLTSTASCSSSSSSALPQAPKDRVEEESVDKQIAACSENTTMVGETRLRAVDDPTLALPKPSRADWKAELVKLRSMAEDPSVADDEKIRLLHEALQQRIEDTRSNEEVKASVLKRLETLQSDQDRCEIEIQRINNIRGKLEACCREQKETMTNLAKENQQIAEEEQSRHTELKDKFQAAIKDVQEKMDAELEVRQGFLKENDDLRGKLQKFNETYETQEAQLAEQQENRNKEMQAAQERLTEHEAMCAASKVNASQLEKQNEGLKKTQTTLQNDLQGILKKFDEFSTQVTGSNKRHSECKEEIDSLQSHMEELEKENVDLRNSARLSELSSEQQVMQKQRDALEKLCDNLHKENQRLKQQLPEKR